MRISRLMLLSAPAILIAACGTETQPQDTQNEQPASGEIAEAPAVPLVGPEGEMLGEVHGGDSAEGAVLQISAQGLPEGVHGLHIHAVGRCDGPTFESAGGHWNPENRQHGLNNPEGPHRGDLPNVTVGEDGNLQETVRISGSHLQPSRLYGMANPIIDDDGAALVLHAGPDDYETDPSGASGERIACAVLGGTVQPED